MMAFIYIFIGGGLGSLARYGFGVLAKRYFNFSLPIGTLMANIVSCFVVGITIYLFKDKIQLHSFIQSFILIGFCGGLSTFSTFSNETAELINQGNWIWAIGNIFISIILGVLMIYWLRYKL